MKPLPVDEILPQLIKILNEHQAVVIRAPTGSGKTTRVPPAILASGLLGSGQLVMLQPRRVAARACAAMMARAFAEPVGEQVGYRIRFESRETEGTRILVMTEGILTRRFISDPMLEGISCVILDEFHERSRHSDMALAFLHELLEVRDDLKVVVMSATLDAGPISDYLNNCPVLEARGRTWPLDIRYLPLPLKASFQDQVMAGLDRLFADPEDDGGHVLVFLPGAPEIARVKSFLEQRQYPAEIMQLHGSLSSREQDQVLSPGGNRRIILSTNIAETSLTIEGVTAVVDCGYRKALFHDVNRGFDRLDLVRISRAGADQRAGRAGRTAPGRVIRLWDESRHLMLAAQDPAEIATSDLSSMVLEMIDFHGPDLNTFPFFERPPADAMTRSLGLLRMLGALTPEHRLTVKGKHLNELPLHPRIACILEHGARRGLLGPAATICAMLSEKPLDPGGDLWEQLAWIEGRGRGRTFDPVLLNRIRDVRSQLLRQGRSLWPDADKSENPSPSEREMNCMLLAGYPDRICQVRGPGLGVMVGGRGVAFEGPSNNFSWFLALELVESGQTRTAGRARRIVPLSLEDITNAVQVQQVRTAIFDPERQAVLGVSRVIFEDLILEEKIGVAVPASELEAVLIQQARARFDQVFKPEPKALALLMRLRFAARYLPEENWPDYSEAGLADLMAQSCSGMKRFDELRRLDWYNILLSRLPWPLRQLLDAEVPEKLPVPSGSQIAIDYAPAFEAASFPVLAVRLQELFGQADTPTLARGRVPLLLHLLAPNMRPCQVTRDLRSFWDNTYVEVRRELRQRYPKHSWPDDPWSAVPMRGTKKQNR